MSISAEGAARNEKFMPWLNENPYMDRSIPWVERGLKAGATEEARKAYAEYCTEEKSRMEKGIKA
jgi:hypothetical protein